MITDKSEYTSIQALTLLKKHIPRRKEKRQILNKKKSSVKSKSISLRGKSEMKPVKTKETIPKL